MEHHLQITIMPGQVQVFFRLLARGVRIDVASGSSVQDIMLNELGLDEGYVEQRIQTVFLNNKPVDRIDTALITEGATLALSSAMPGLVGATLRRAGHFSSMRSQISHENESIPQTGLKAELTLKLFNLVAMEIGPGVLSRGVRAGGMDFQNIILNRLGEFQEQRPVFKLNESGVDQDALLAVEWETCEVFLELIITD
jgi:hypothetical protein